MGFLRPATLFMLPITYAWFRWLPCQSWGFLQWPGLKEFLLFLLVSITFSNFSYVPSSSMKPTIRLGDWIIIQRVKVFTLFFHLLLSLFSIMTIRNVFRGLACVWMDENYGLHCLLGYLIKIIVFELWWSILQFYI